MLSERRTSVKPEYANAKEHIVTIDGTKLNDVSLEQYENAYAPIDEIVESWLISNDEMSVLEKEYCSIDAIIAPDGIVKCSSL